MCSASADAIQILGSANVEIQINNLRIIHTFIVADNSFRTIILEKDLLAANTCRIYFDLNVIILRDQYVALQDDASITSLVRLCKTTELTYHTSYRMALKLKHNPSISNDISYEVASVTEGFMTSEPYLHITNSLAFLNKKRRIPVLLLNCSTTLYV